MIGQAHSTCDIEEGDIIGRALPLICIGCVPASWSRSGQLNRGSIGTDALAGGDRTRDKLRIYRDGHRIGGTRSATGRRSLVQPVPGGLGQGAGLVIQAGRAGYVCECDIICRALPLVRIGGVPSRRSHAVQLSWRRIVTDALIGRDSPHYKVRINRNRHRIGGQGAATRG